MQDGTMERGYTFEELWTAARRRARVALAVAGAVLVVGAIVVASLPDEFRAEATIILEPYRPHAELVTPAVTTLLEDRMRVARQQLLATPLLERVVQEHGLYPKARAAGGLDAAVRELRAHLSVHPDGDSAVIVAFVSPQREKAAAVVDAVARGFVDSNAQLRTAQSQRVLDILSSELERVQKALDVREAEVRDFRLAHDGELPDQVEANLREAERATRLLDSTQMHIRDLERRRALLPSTPVSAEADRLATTEAELVRRLNHARSLFSDDHPEPVRLERELAGILALKTAALQRAETGHQERAALGREINRARTDARALEERIQQARERAGASARWAAELAVLERDRDLLREKYRSLMSRKVEGEVALGLEQQAAPHATRIVSPATEPTSPSAPDRLRLLGVVLALAAGLGVAAGVLLESRDSTVRTPAQARSQLSAPLLAVLPPLEPRRTPER